MKPDGCQCWHLLLPVKSAVNISFMIKVCKGPDDTAAKMLSRLTLSHTKFSCIMREDELRRIKKEKEPKCGGEDISWVQFERKDSAGWVRTDFILGRTAWEEFLLEGVVRRGSSPQCGCWELLTSTAHISLTSSYQKDGWGLFKVPLAVVFPSLMFSSLIYRSVIR